MTVFQFLRAPIFLVLLTLLFGLAGCASNNFEPLRTESYVDPDKFAGEWFVIANIPYFAERNKVASRTIYQKREDKDNLYDDIFIYRNKNFSNKEKRLVGKIRSVSSNNTQWRSTFYGFINFTFDVLHVDANYQMTLFGHPSRKYGWVMSRENKVSEDQYKTAMTIFKDNGYDVSKFLKVPQTPGQMGQDGFQ